MKHNQKINNLRQDREIEVKDLCWLRLRMWFYRESVSE